MKEKGSIESKRDVLEFLWEWAEEKGLWAKLLLHETLSAPDSLAPDKLEVIYRHFRKSIGLVETIEEVKIEKPNYTLSGKTIRLKKLHKITGLNRLSPDSVLEFSPNLTVVYGDNGTGKSGFSRILKDIGYSYEKETKILPNIYSAENQDISAEIDYECNGTASSFTWKPGVTQEELKSISVYTNSCVAISLSDNRSLIVTPLGFSFFDRISSELGKLLHLLTKEKESLQTDCTWFEFLHEGTVCYNASQKLQTIKEQDIKKLLVFTQDAQKSLDIFEKQYAGMTKELLEKEINDLKIQSAELTKIKREIENSKRTFTQVQWLELRQTSIEIRKLKAKGYGSLEGLAKEKGIELYGKAEFEEFIKSADAYLNTFTSEIDYPNSEEAKCIYCNQLLNEASSDLLKKYKAILVDTTRQDIQKQEVKLSILFDLLKSISADIKLHYSSYGQDTDQQVIQPEYIEAYNCSIAKLKSAVDSETHNGIEFCVDYDSTLDLLQKRIDELNESSAEKNKTLSNLESEKLELHNKINELRDRKIFAEKKDDVLMVMKNYAIKNLLEEKQMLLNSGSISAKTTKARKELIEQSFSNIFSKEIEKLRRTDIKIELGFGTKKGEPNINQRLQNKYALSEILSEGEQKAISLAEYFTELSIDGNVSPVVFDDPVNSLDHHIIDEMAKRLIMLSITRQTIVFTHSVLLFNSLLNETEQPYHSELRKSFYRSEKNFDLCGIIYEAEELNSVSYYIKNIEDLINKKEGLEKDIVSKGYDYLRSAIELTMENKILKGTVKRYQKNISLSNFIKISGEDIDKYKMEINDLFDKCCRSITAHSNPTEIVSAPNISQLKADFEKYKAIRKNFS